MSILLTVIIGAGAFLVGGVPGVLGFGVAIGFKEASEEASPARCIAHPGAQVRLRSIPPYHPTPVLGMTLKGLFFFASKLLVG
mgnify:CR=1